MILTELTTDLRSIEHAELEISPGLAPGCRGPWFGKDLAARGTEALGARARVFRTEAPRSTWNPTGTGRGHPQTDGGVRTHGSH
jgi:hypothetical protein